MQKLFDGFSPVSAFEWKARIEKDLKEITFESLLKTDRNGIIIKPFYNNEDSNRTEPVFDNADWEICATVIVKDAVTANKDALFALQNGASGIQFIINDLPNLTALLKDISIAHIYIQFVVKSNEAAFFVAFQNYVADAGLELKQLNCSILTDPIGDFIVDGTWKSSLKAEKLNFTLIHDAKQELFSINADGSIYQNSGATQITELAATLAHINEYLCWLDEAKKLSSLKKVHVTLAAGTDFFEEIAKLRAFRELATLLFDTYQISPLLHLHCETSDIYRSSFDSYTNILRDSISGMSSVLGGCNSLTIHSFNHENTDFSNRISRNQQLIFKEESYLNKVADAAAGSFFIEKLTEQIAEKAWQKFKAIEEQGGLIAVASNRWLYREIKQEASSLIEDYKTGKRVLIGVNKYPNPGDPPKKHGRKISSALLKKISITDELISE